MEIFTPDGRRHQREVPPAAVRLPLSSWLEGEHLPLNTRCGERGLCRGCLVRVDGRMLRACQAEAGAFETVSIPDASFRDNRLNGVSSFEIGTHRYALRTRPGIGLALDIGTTTVAGALWNLADGTCLAHASAANEQRRFGDNVLSRIDHAVGLGGASPALQSALVKDTLEPLIHTLCAAASIDPARITEAVAAGNTVMLHGFAGARLSGFAAYPFRPEFLGRRTLRSRDLGFTPDFPVFLGASPGPFVGADITLGALASGILEEDAPALLVDFGTNGEILLKTGDGYLATATAAGPAFEGGRLNCGAIAGKGVISSMALRGGEWKVTLAGELSGRITGISGAAYVDFIAEALRAGILNRMGRFDTDHPAVERAEVDGEMQRCVKVCGPLFVSEADVAELIQAKAAIAAGVMTLLELAETRPGELRTVYIAGGFGYHLNCAHAMAVGMLPDVPAERLHVIGNASLGGASLVLQSDAGSAADTLCGNCRVVELNQIDCFEDHFIDCMPLERIS
ncbi:MAG: DUF4445 domain-containing protein [Opitutales bacterium]|nr:DUF4445 domain-containing protein [Opitutales bacterium]